MKKNPYPGLFIVLEGLDGSGSTTQMNLLYEYLKKEGYSCYTTREPTNNIIGGLIRGQLSHDWQTKQECLQLLFAADRAHHLEKEVVPSLKQGNIVISDRYFLSSIAYGSIDIKNLDWLITINNLFILPDITILLEVSPKICLERIKGSRFSIELFEEENKLKETWKTYEKLTKKFPNIKFVNGELPPEKVLEQVIKVINEAIKEKGILKRRTLL